MGRRRERGVDRESEAALRGLLNEWNPIGVGGLPADEYDCLLWPLWGQLIHGGTPDSTESFLTEPLEEHFGLPSKTCRVAEFARKVFDWRRRRTVR
ncbi:MAG: hypothetical protein A3F84_19935 [Candidatus Handelsmanbacteria bacterium RIFCSPLOWO2_12_FULL_64_10]|uniref:Uncharacterized protein n=1 Tax=Handelsmanbacteria sp. (strain RIFCSPLOWO2_12_FULL_64_10) TaxID=1817868 RepID=A0A1F6D281_HANXR|nr:MAG: hypothetical protein A3F84_19935 [Candidatus Handelsmanbacteria bacterium RIFCSPLOWO2_12_FULL_64_10]